MVSLTLVLLAGQACAAPGLAVEPHEVREWLTRIHNAANQRNFQGTFVVSSPGAMTSARISHFYVGADQFERIEPLDGQARQVLRHNGVVHTVWPFDKVALVEQRDVVKSFPSLLQDADDHVADFYDVSLQPSERVAGHEANVLMLKPRDEFRYGYRLWTDKQSGLLLRAEILNALGETLETSAFSSVDIGVRAQPDMVLLPMRKLAGYRVLKPQLTPTRLEAEGWKLRKTVAGFRQLSCIRRPLDVMATADSKAAAGQLIQTVFSDGITNVSLFIEPYNADRHPRPAITVVGATQTLMSRQGDFWITVVGDVPRVTLRAFYDAVDRNK
ncbi:MAG: transcriptional regulator [Burkholderiales bacterium PBB1]|jgi:sigma-E factor negative regulatory protein RseB|nr:MAG: transcriptional regulator [Burkholderiales bacterium PBB1]